MTELHLINPSASYTQSEAEEKLFQKFWTITESEAQGEISFESLQNFIFAAMNFFLPSMSHNIEITAHGRLVNGKYMVNQAEVQKIHKIFKQFYENRTATQKEIQLKSERERYGHSEFSRNKSGQIKVVCTSFKPENEVKNPNRNSSRSRLSSRSRASAVNKEKSVCENSRNMSPRDKSSGVNKLTVIPFFVRGIG